VRDARRRGRGKAGFCPSERLVSPAMRIYLFALAMLGVACSGSSHTVASPAPSVSVAAALPPLRLPRTFVPSAYQARLTIDPAKTTFDGAITIDGEVTQSAPVFWLHGRHLTIHAAVASAVGGGPETRLAITARGEDLLEVRPSSPLARGKWRLSLTYTGEIDELNTTGVFRQTVAGAAYVYTQLEAIYARRVFPCIDEPDSKVPWQLTLDVPGGVSAVSNTPLAQATVLPTGGTRYEFQPSQPLPSYLVAFGVGPFDIVEAPASRSGVVVRIITLQGRAADAAYAAQTTAPILDLLEDWFGIPYAYGKLDILTIPLTVGFGAMENAGLVTFSERLSLFEQTRPSWQRRYVWVRVAAHELAHQWFGDYVTSAWWDDIWLNEGFANWMEAKITTRFLPAWQDELSDLDMRNQALEADSVISARQIRQPIVTPDDILNVFDDITYDKGATVLNMFESYVGAQVFQRGVRQYLKSRAHGNATSKDFVAAISQAASVDLAPAFATFLDQPGTPELDATLECGEQAPRLVLSQQRYVRPGSPTPPAGQPWIFPVCVAYDRDGKRAEACTLLEGAGSIALPAERCPRWVMPNVAGRGYYRSTFSPAQVTALRELAWPELSWAERRALFFDVTNAARYAARARDATIQRPSLPLALALSLVPEMLRGAERFPIADAVAFASGLDRSVPDELRAEYERWLRSTFSRAARKLGVLPRAEDDLDSESSRRELVHAAAWLGRDPELVKSAIAQGAAWHELPQSIRGAILALAVDSDARLFAQTISAVKTEPDRARRREMLAALAAVRDRRRVLTAFELVLDPALDFRETMGMLAGTSSEATRRVAETFVRDHLDALMQRMPRDEVSGGIAAIAWLFTSSCDAVRRDEIVAYTTTNFASLPGGKRTVDQAIEAMDQCIAAKAALEPQIRSWLAAGTQPDRLR